MPEENVDIVRKAHEQFARGDTSWFASVTDDFEFVSGPDLPDAGTYRGDAAREWLMEWIAAFDRHTVQVTEMLDAGRDKVFRSVVQRVAHAKPSHD